MSHPQIHFLAVADDVGAVTPASIDVDAPTYTAVVEPLPDPPHHGRSFIPLILLSLMILLLLPPASLAAPHHESVSVAAVGVDTPH